MNPFLPNDRQSVDDGPSIKEYNVDYPCPKCGGDLFRTVFTWSDGVVETQIDCDDCSYIEKYNSEVDL